jgi:hypothetical protein
MTESWREYEDVAKHLLNRFAEDFGLDRVEGKQSLLGLRSSTNWEIDAKGVSIDGQVDFRLNITDRTLTTAKKAKPQPE